MTQDHDDWFEDDDLVREGGVFVSRNGGREIGPDEDEQAPDDYVEDSVNDEGVPGTVDDLPYDYGVENARAADETLETIHRADRDAWDVGETGPAGEGEEPSPGKAEERELWDRQRPLIEESDAEERHYSGLPESEIPEISEASLEDAEDVLPDSPDGVSATGDVSE